MVYDERSNFVGDAHWREDSEFNEGEELELERGGILVEVGECIGKKDQDLSELLDKRAKEKEGRAATMAAHSTTRSRQISTPANSQHMRPKPLNAVIGMPSGHYGRAMVSNLSPFEQKHASNQDHINTRPTKRQKQNDTPSKSGYAQNLLGATLSLGSTRPSNTQTIRYEPLKASISRPQAGTIDLTLDENSDGVVPGYTRDEGTRSKSSAKMQKRNSDRTPNSSSGYASNLTGAQLSLSRPTASTSANPPKGLSRATKATVSPPQDGSPNTSIYQTKITAKPTTKSKPLEDLDIPNQQVSSTLTSKPSRVKSTKKPATGHTNEPTRVSIAKKMIAEQPVTALRIKPRPPRKMMMLMELPRPPQSAGMLAGGGKVRSTTSKVTDGAGIGITPGCNLNSSPLSDMDTEDIDAPLRPITDTNRDSPDGSAIAHGQPTLLDARILEEDSTKPISHPSLTAMSNTIELEQPENLSLLDGIEALPHRTSQPGEAFEAVLLQPHVTAGGNNHVVMEKSNDPSESASMYNNFDAEHEQMVAGTYLGLTVAEGALSTVSEVPHNPNNGSIPSTNHCRQNPTTSVSLDGEALLHIRASKEKEKPELSRAKIFTTRKIETGTSEIIIKASPASTPARIVNQVDYPGQTVEKARSSIVPPRGRVVNNPATLRSFAKAATSRAINSRAIGSNILPGTAPPPIRSLRPEITAIKEDAGLCVPRRETIPCGPWSRESFDLFGTWRPPGRPANLSL